MMSTIENLKKKYKNKVTFVIVDYDDPANKDQIKEYSVSMNPTIIIFNAKGEIKETFMGTAREDMLAGRIEGLLPSSGTNTSGQPGTTTTPITTSPVFTSSPGSTQMSAPGQ
jgi:thioredoxin-like negative regulator of GroEL